MIRSCTKFPKSWLWTLLCRQKIHPFFVFHTWVTRLKYLPKGCPYILMYSALHIVQWFSKFEMCSPRKSDKNFFDFKIFMYQNKCRFNLKWSLEQSSALQLQRQTDLLLCTINFYCFIQWVHPQNMAIGDLAFYYTLYLWFWQNVTINDFTLPLRAITYNWFIMIGNQTHLQVDK